MAQLSKDEFDAKWDGRFADNQIQNIDEPTLREFKQDIADSFALLASVSATPVAPAVNFDPVARQLTASHPLGSDQLEYSHDNGGFTGYAPLAIDDGTHPQGEWRYRVVATTGRNPSQTTDSPAILAKAANTPAGPGTIKAIMISDSTVAGRALLTAADVAAQRALLDQLGLVAEQYGAGQPKFDTLYGEDGALAYILRHLATQARPAAPTQGHVDNTAKVFFFRPNPLYPSFAQYSVGGLPAVAGAVVLDALNSYVSGELVGIHVNGPVPAGGLVVYVTGSGNVPNGVPLLSEAEFTGPVAAPEGILNFSVQGDDAIINFAVTSI
jgi:hypothetical protein